jgi:hypothetical protein
MERVPALVFTPEEKRVLIFILFAFILGIATKQYRDSHPPAPAPQKMTYKERSHRPAQLNRSVVPTQQRQGVGPD